MYLRCKKPLLYNYFATGLPVLYRYFDATRRVSVDLEIFGPVTTYMQTDIAAGEEDLAAGMGIPDACTKTDAK
jgi:hypothetical protein